MPSIHIRHFVKPWHIASFQDVAAIVKMAPVGRIMFFPMSVFLPCLFSSVDNELQSFIRSP